MRFAAVLTESGVGAWSAVRGRGGMGLAFKVARITECAVVLFTMRARTNRADDARIIAVVGVVTPSTAAKAERHTNMHGCLAEIADRHPNVESAIYESLHTGTGLGVPDVEIDGTGVRASRITNDPRGGS